MQFRGAKLGLAITSAVLLVNFLSATCSADDKTDTPPAESKKAEVETTLPGFQGIKWGNSIEVARERMKTLKDFVPVPAMSNDNKLTYAGGKLGGQEIPVLILEFTDEGFYYAAMSFKGTERNVFSRYREIQELLGQKYGKPQDNERIFVRPYFEGDGYETQAVRLGKAFIYSLWRFPREKGGKTDDEIDSLRLMISDSYNIFLYYVDGPRKKRWDDKKKKEAAQDF